MQSGLNGDCATFTRQGAHMSFHCRSSFMFRAPLSLLAPTCKRTTMRTSSAAANQDGKIHVKLL